MKRVCLLLAAGMLTVAPAMAADESGDFRVKGIGLETCQNYLAAKAANQPLPVFAWSWLNGYLTAYNQINRSTYDIAGQANLNALVGWLDQYCQANPGQTLVVAATSMTAALEPTKLSRSPSPTQALTTAQSQETIRNVQQALKDRGYYKGGVDGLFGPGTSKAIEAFQRAEGLSVSGQPDAPTMNKLFRQ